MVFNPHPYAITDHVECEFVLADQNWSVTDVSRILVKDGEALVPYQVIKEESNLNLDWRKRVVFQASLPPMSLKRYSIYIETVPVAKPKLTDCLVFDNGHKYVEVDKNTGLLRSYRIGGTEYVQNGFCLTMFDDNPDPWAMGKDQLKQIGTNPAPFTLSATPNGIFKNMKSVQVIEDGEIYLGVEAFFEKENSKARIEYRIYKNNDDVDVNVTLFLGDVNKIIKLAVPVQNAGKVIGQTAFGTDTLFTDGREIISHRFTAVQSGEQYLAVFDKSRYGGHFEDGTLYLSLARGTTYCAHPIEDRQLIPDDRYTKKMDQGEHNYFFRLSLCDERELDRKANEFNRKPYAVNVFPLGETDAENKFDVCVSNKNISLVTMKKADKKDGYILRLINNYKDSQETDLTVGNATKHFVFGKYEVKTLFYDGSLQELDTMAI